MLINKTLLVGLVFTLTYFNYPAKAVAPDLTVTCNNVSCTANGSSLFNYANITPGFSVTRSVLIDNSANSDSCNLYIYTTRDGVEAKPDLAEKMLIVIKTDTVVYFGDESGLNPKRFTDLIGQNIYLGLINASDSVQYSWSAEFEANSGNNYQSSSVAFGFSLSFTCGTPPIGIPPILLAVVNPLVLGVGTDNINQDVMGLVSTDNNIVEDGNVMGLLCETANNWWIILIIQAILSIIVLTVKHFKPLIKRLWLLIILFAIVSQLAHNYFGCPCITDDWCSRYIILNIAVALFSLLGYNLTRVNDKIS